MRRSDVLLLAAAAIVLALSLTVGWQREMTRIFPDSGLPRVDLGLIDRQTEAGNLAPREGLYYRTIHAGMATP